MMKTRILAKDEELRKLLLLIFEDDGSIYARSYLRAKHYKKGSFKVPCGGKIHISYSEGEFRDLITETGVKVSFHPSGVTHIKTENKRRECLFKIKYEEREGIEDCRELATILPRNTTRYPIMYREPSKSDVMLPIQNFDRHPFVVKLYLTKKDFDLKRVVSPKMYCVVLVGFEGYGKWYADRQLGLLAYQTEETRKTDKFPPNEYWLLAERQ